MEHHEERPQPGLALTPTWWETPSIDKDVFAAKDLTEVPAVSVSRGVAILGTGGQWQLRLAQCHVYVPYVARCSQPKGDTRQQHQSCPLEDHEPPIA
jgi:hypothetical protein